MWVGHAVQHQNQWVDAFCHWYVFIDGFEVFQQLVEGMHLSDGFYLGNHALVAMSASEFDEAFAVRFDQLHAHIGRFGDELLENLEATNEDVPVAERVNPLILVLDGVTDPHNLGACLRVADGAGVHAVIAPKDNAAGINATVAKVASGAAETVPYFMVTNLARTLNELKERNIWIIGTSDQATKNLYQADLKGPVALVLGAEGDGIRQLTAKTCDELISIPMMGAVRA